jgi:hypothetical protein
MEVNHGPFLIDNNLFLSSTTLLDMSQGGVFAHNLIAGKIVSAEELRRETPYHPAHSTVVAGLAKIPGGDNRWHNNVFVGAAAEPARPADASAKARQRFTGHGLWVYDTREQASQAAGNIYYRSARPYAKEPSPLLLPQADPQVKLVEEGDRVFLQTQFAADAAKAATQPVTTALLGRAKIPDLPYENPDGSPLTIDSDYFGEKRATATPTAGPFETPGAGPLKLKVW